MTYPVADVGTVALLDPATGRFDDSLAPPSVAAAVAAAQQAVVDAQTAAAAAQASAVTAGGSDSSAQNAQDAAASAAAAVAAANAAESQAAQASSAAAAALAATAGGTTAAQIAAALAALPTVTQTGSYTDLVNKPPDLGPAVAGKANTTDLAAGLALQVHTADLGQPNKAAPLDAAARLPLANLPTLVPIWIGDGSATIPVRPAYAGRVVFDTTSPPPLTGTIAGGTPAAVDGLDRWWT